MPMRRSKTPHPSYFEGGRIAVSAMAELFDAAAELYRLAPWKMLVDDMPIAVDVPGQRVYGGAIAVIGALGESFGFLLFDSLPSYDAFGDALDEGGPPNLDGFVLSLNFEPRDVLPAPMLREIAEHRLPVAGADAHPVILCLAPDGERRPVSPADVRLAVTCTRALVQLFSRQEAFFRERRPGSVTEEIDAGGGELVRLRAPHPDARPLDPDNPCACGSGRTFGGCHLQHDPRDPERCRRRADYDGWPDRRIPALDGRTPRDAMREPDGRATVRALLAFLEMREAEFPPDERVDLGGLRRIFGFDE
jgi:hypothetical protein